MVWRAAGTLLKWAVGLGLLGGVLAGAYSVHVLMRDRRAADATADSVQVPKRAANNVVKLGATLAESHGIRDEPASGFVERDPKVTADNAGAELENGHVTFADGSGAQHEPCLAPAEAALVGMLDHGGVREGRPLRGLFVGEVGADQPALVVRRFGIGRQA